METRKLGIGQWLATEQAGYGLANGLQQNMQVRQSGDRCRNAGRSNKKRYKMLHYALIFFLVAIVAAVLGFGGVSAASAGVAKILFFLFLVIFLVTLVMGVARRA